MKVEYIRQELYPGIYQIHDPLGFCCILAVGHKRALLFDTMAGVGDLRAYVEEITSLPVTVVLSHNHFDHIGGSVQFPNAYLAACEHEDFGLQMSYRERLYTSLVNSGHFEGFYFAPHHGTKPALSPLSEKASFDLGGLILTAVSLPGHTAGSMGLLCEQHKVLFTGDSITPIMCLFFPTSLEIDDYIATLHKMEQIPFDYFVTNHHTRKFSKALLPDYLACARFSQMDTGMKYQHDLLTEYTGRLHIYSGDNCDADDFLALISKPLAR